MDDEVVAKLKLGSKKAKIEAAIERVKKALETENFEEMKSATEALTTVYGEAAQKLYEQAAQANAAAGQAGAAGAAGAGPQAGPSDAQGGGDKDDAVDADYEVVSRDEEKP